MIKSYPNKAKERSVPAWETKKKIRLVKFLVLDKMEQVHFFLILPDNYN